MLRYRTRHYELLALLRQHDGEWLTFAQITGKAPVNDRIRLNELVENGDVMRRSQVYPKKAGERRGRARYEYQLVKKNSTVVDTESE